MTVIATKAINKGTHTSTATCTSVTGSSSCDNYALTNTTQEFTINAQSVNPITNLAVSTSGVVSWTASSNATGYQISIDGTTWTDMPSSQTSYNYINTIASTIGERTVYVRAINSDTTNYSTVDSGDAFAHSSNVTTKVNTYRVTATVNNADYGTVNNTSSNGYIAIEGMTYSTSGNVLTFITGASSTARTIDLTGYTTTFTGWSSSSGTITANTIITANFTRTANSYTVTANANGGSIASTTGWTGTGNTSTKSVTYNSTYGTLPSVSRTGYDFDGWYKPDYSTAVYKEVLASTVLRLSPFSAYTSSTINFEKGDVVEFDIDVVGTTISHADLNDVSISGLYTITGGTNIKGRVVINDAMSAIHGSLYYNFLDINNNGAPTSYTINKLTLTKFDTEVTSSSTVNIASDHSIEAKWTPVTYNITYDLRDGSVSTANPSTYNIETATFSLNNPTRSGYTFEGWTENQDQIKMINDFELPHTFEAGSNNTLGNTKLQILKTDYTYLTQLGSTSTVGHYSNSFTSTYDSGMYIIRFAANGSTTDPCKYFYAYIENGVTYNFEWDLLSKSSSAFQIDNFRFYRANGSNTNVPIKYTKTGSYGNKSYTANWSKAASNLSVTLGTSSYNYDGSAKEPTVTVKDGTTTIPSSEYTVSYSNNTNAGTATVTVTMKGNYYSTTKATYTGSTTTNFTINRAGIALPTCTTTYDKTEQTLLSSTTTYTVANSPLKKTNAGTYKVNVTPTANYKWSSDGTTTAKEVSCVINQRELDQSLFTTGNTSKTYNGNTNSSITLTANATSGVISGDSVTVSYTGAAYNNANVASASSISVTGITLSNSNYKVKNTSQSYSGTITRANVAFPSCSAVTYNKSEQTLFEAHSGDYSNNVLKATNAGTYTVALTPSANHKWTDTGATTARNLSCTINKYNISSATVSTIPNKTYDGNDYKPTPSVTVPLPTSTNTYTLTDSEYSYSYSAEHDATVGQYTVTMTAKADTSTFTNNYTGSVSKTYSVVQANGYVNLSAESGSVTYGTSSKTFTVSSSHGGTLSVTDSRSTPNTTINNGTVTVNGLGSLASGTSITVTVTSAATTNYKQASATYTLTVTNAAITCGTVTITGNNVVGETLTATNTTTPSDVTKTYQWYTNTSDSTSGGSAIANATSSTFTLTSSQVGKYIYATITCSKTNYTTSSNSGKATTSANKTATTKTKVAKPTTAKCSNPTYSGSAQTITSTADDGYAFSNNSATNYSSTGYTVTAALSTNYIWSDYSTANHTINCNIARRNVTYKADDQSKTYDGTALSANNNCTLTTGTLVSGHSATCSNSGSITYYGTTGSTTKTLSSVTIMSGTTDVTENYNISKTNGTLSITKKALSITAKAQTIVYGSSIATGTSQVTPSGLVSGDSLTAITLTPSTSAVTASGTITPSAATVKNSSNTDITSSYSITNTAGTLTINNAQVTFNANDGTLSGTSPLYTKKDVKVFYSGIRNTASASIPTATRDGYTFSGWYTAASGGTQVIDTSGNVKASVSNWTDSSGNFTITSNQTLHAGWTPHVLTVVIHPNGATKNSSGEDVSDPLSTEQLAYNTTVGYNWPTDYQDPWGFKLVRTGYTADGKYHIGSGSSTNTIGQDLVKQATPISTIAESLGVLDALNAGNTTVHLYAGWTPNTYTVTYNGNGNNGGSTAQSTHTYDVAKNLTSNGFTKTGYSFAGWATSASGAVAYTNGQSVSNLTSTNGGNVDLFAKWTIDSHTVTYNYSQNGGTSATKTSDTVNYGSAIDLTPTATKANYTFVGWNTNKDATSGLSSLNMSTSNVTLYAIFRRDITITFNKNGASTQTNASGTAVSDATVTRSCSMYNNATSCTITSPTIAATSGFSVIGYNTSSGATSSTWSHNTAKTDVSASTTSTWYAVTKSTAQYTATTKKNVSSATGTDTSVSCYRYNGSNSCNVSAPTNPYTLSEWTFNGWVNAGSSTTTTTTSGTTSGNISISGNVNLVATWKKDVTVTFDKNGGSANTSASGTIYNGAGSITIKTPSATSRSNWTFNGYATTNSATTSGIVAAGNNITVNVASDSNAATAYHTWKKTVTVTVTFDKNGGTSNTSATGTTTIYNGATSIPSGTSITFTAPSCTSYSGWTCLGYADSASDTASEWNVSSTKSISVAGLSVADNENTASKASGYYHIWRSNSQYTATTKKNVTSATGTDTSVSCYRYNGSNSCNVAAPTNPYTLSEWTFNGWVNAGSSTTTTTTSGATSGNISISGNVNLVATWKKDVTVTFDKNGGSANTSASGTIYNGAGSITIKTPSATSRSNWTFNGYATTNSATTSGIVAAGNNITVNVASDSNAATAYHTWKKTVTVTVTFDKNGGTSNTSATGTTTIYNGATSIPSGTSITFTAPSCTSYSGWTCLGYADSASDTASEWNVSSTKSISVAGLSVADNANTASKASGYYHIWRKEYSSTFTLQDSNAATASANSASCYAYNGAASCTITTTPTLTAKSGYTAVGWGTATTSTSAASSFTSGNTYYSVTYNSTALTGTFTIQDTDAATQSGGTTSCYRYNGSNSCKLKSPTLTNKTGYTVVGWKKDGTTSSTSSDLASNTEVTVTGNVTYKSVTYNNTQFTATTQKNVTSATGTGTSVSCYRYNGNNNCNVSLPNNPYTLSSYTFIGWANAGTATTSSATSGTAAGQSLNLTGNTNIVAIWRNTNYNTQYTATFWYNDNSTSGSITLKSTSKSCNIAAVYNGATVPTTCAVDVQARSSVGKYNSAYAGYASSTSSMTAAIAKGTTSINLSSSPTYYAIYQSPITIYYPNTSNTVSNSATALYRNEYMTSTSAMSTITSNGTNTTSASSVTLSSLKGTFSGLNATVASTTPYAVSNTNVVNTNTTTFYAITSATVKPKFYYSNSSSGSKTYAEGSGTATYYCSSTSAMGTSNSSVSAPTLTGEQAPYGTSPLTGFATSATSMSTTTTYNTGGTYYRVYRGNVTNYYWNGSSHTSRTLYRNGYYGSSTNYTMVLSTTNTGTSNYTTESGPNSAAWKYLMDASTGSSYSTVAAAATSSYADLKTIYQYTVTYAKGSNVYPIGKTSDTCTFASQGSSTTTCQVTLPSITPNTGHTSVGWSTTNGATTGTAAGEYYTITNNTTKLYANAIEVRAVDVYYDNTLTGMTCETVQCALDSISRMLNRAGAKSGGNNYLCKIMPASGLHTATISGSTVTFGRVASSYGVVGNTYICDVNGDKTYNATNEVFYYVSSPYPEYATLISSNSVSAGSPSNTAMFAYDSTNNNWYGPRTAIAQLPETTLWKDVGLYKNTRTILAFDHSFASGRSTTGGTTPTYFSYKGYSGRFLSLGEVRANCSATETVGSLDNCKFLLENTYYQNTSFAYGWWLENPDSSNNNQIWRVGGQNRYVRSNSDSNASNSTMYAVRPAIEVRKCDIEGSGATSCD